ncbi:MAG: undecaprenyl-diphosphate phosphatase [Armatimonadota bacterium]|nr:undecaprenyl-diphosphate phosphatase [Armatimonadota bacterium]MCX7777948.1 undecaprenyl-diphosphate phosphatase [Armatimonadota bacterium]MDW8025296.1 undecaprenyl-diphosphate phosphatase [Armatimonadota bacterium]
MSIWHVVLLATLQGLTEFLPISSSGHLALLENLLGWTRDEGLQAAMLPFNAVLHFGTLLSIIAYFRADLLAMLMGKTISPGNLAQNDSERICSCRADRSWLLLILAANIPTGIIGLMLERSGVAELATASMLAVGSLLALTGILLILSERMAKRSVGVGLCFWRAIFVGCIQGLAVLPGLSRSGATIAAGLMVGLEKDVAVRFAFLVSVPAVIAATMLELRDLLPNAHINISHIIIGCTIAAIVGYAAIGIVVRAVNFGRFSWFAPYCFAVSVIVLALSYRSGG